MHLTLKKEATKPAGHNLLQQQDKFDTFKQEYNYERPHQALDMRFPAEVYSPSAKLIQRRAYGFRNFENYRLRVRVLCS